MAGNTVRITAKTDDKASGPLDRIQDKFERIQKTGAKGFGIGAAAGATTFGLNAIAGAADMAASAVIDFFSSSIQKAAEEEAGIKKLTTSIEANAKGWDGNIDAVEKVIEAREKLAFSDGEQRESLAVLVARTKDVTKALALQRQAMDLARLKGIDLATASEVVGKVYSGNVGILTRYGIAVTKGSTATEALAELQKSAAGQADEFAKTTEGAMLSAQIAVEDLQEDIGKELLPVVRDLSEWARDEGVPALRDFVKTVKDAGPVLEVFGYALGHLTPQQQADGLREAAKRTLELHHYVATTTEALDSFDRRATGAADATGDLADEAAGARPRIKGLGGAAQKAADAFADLRKDAKAAGDAVAEAAYGPEHLQLEFAKNKSELKDNQKELTKFQGQIDKAGGWKKAPQDLRDKFLDAKLAVNDSKQAVIETGIELHSIGKITMPQLEATFDRQQIKLENLSGAAREYWYWLHKASGAPGSGGGGIGGGGTPGDARDHGQAGGGVSTRGVTRLVGENGPELFTPESNGRITPNSNTMLGLAGGGGTTVIQVVLDGRIVAEATAPHVTKWQQQRRLIGA